jgi:multidrug efflux system membrane fusion protein
MLNDPRFNSPLVAEKMQSARVQAERAKTCFDGLKKPYRTTILISVGVVLWLLSGLIFGDSPVPEKSSAAGVAQVATVAVIESTAEPRVRNVSLFGVTEPRRTVRLKAETEGRVLEIKVPEGAFVQEGDVILTIADRDRSARVAEASALVKQRESEYNAAVALSKKGYQSDVELKRSAANLASAKAQLSQSRVQQGQTKVRAPFDGVIDRIPVEQGDLVGQGMGGQGEGETDGVAVLIERTPLLAVGQVAERVVRDITVGMPASVKLITGETAEGTVTYLSTVADTATRTFRIEVEVPNAEGKLKAGMTSEITIPVDMEKAHLVPSSALSLNDAGQVGIKVLEVKEQTADGMKGTARFYPVKLTEDVAKGMWVTGLPDKAKVITLGQAFLKEGSEAVGKIIAPEKAAATPPAGKADGSTD